MLYVDFSCYRSKDFELKDQEQNQNTEDLFELIHKESVEPKEDEVTYPCIGVFLPEAEEVLVISNIRKSWTDKSLKLVSDAHKNQQRHGYLQFIPTNKESFQKYWKYAYGISIPEDGVALMEIKSKSDQRIVPSRTVIR